MTTGEFAALAVGRRVYHPSVRETPLFVLHNGLGAATIGTTKEGPATHLIDKKTDWGKRIIAALSLKPFTRVKAT